MKSLLHKHNIYGKDLINYSHSLIDELKEYLSEMGFLLQTNEEGLYKLNDFILKEFDEGNIKPQHFKDFFIHYLIYIGQVYINQNNGKWKMELYSDGVTYIPIVYSKNGKCSKEFIPLLNDILISELNIDKYPSIDTVYNCIVTDCN